MGGNFRNIFEILPVETSPGHAVGGLESRDPSHVRGNVLGERFLIETCSRLGIVSGDGDGTQGHLNRLSGGELGVDLAFT